MSDRPGTGMVLPEGSLTRPPRGLRPFSEVKDENGKVTRTKVLLPADDLEVVNVEFG